MPTDIVSKTGEERTIDGVRIQFMMAQNTEAPSERMFYLPVANIATSTPSSAS